MTEIKRTVVMSDTHGYFDVMIECLDSLGLIEDGYLETTDTRLIHLGDTIHRGPDSGKTFSWLRDQQQRLGEKFVTRLIGNHEAENLGGPRFWGQETEDVLEIIPDMKEDARNGSLKFATTFPFKGQDWLCVHGGYHDSFDRYLEHGAESLTYTDYGYFPPRVLANRINAEGLKIVTGEVPHSTLITGIGWVRGGMDQFGGVLWCDAKSELREIEDLIRHQVVGHRAHDQVTFYPHGNLICVNVPYGKAQALIVDHVNDTMDVSKLFFDRSDK